MTKDPLIATMAQVVDRDRREVCQIIKKANNPVMHMYYEGQRVALARVQRMLEGVTESVPPLGVVGGIDRDPSHVWGYLHTNVNTKENKDGKEKDTQV